MIQLQIFTFGWNVTLMKTLWLILSFPRPKEKTRLVESVITLHSCDLREKMKGWHLLHNRWRVYDSSIAQTYKGQVKTSAHTNTHKMWKWINVDDSGWKLMEVDETKGREKYAPRALGPACRPWSFKFILTCWWKIVKVKLHHGRQQVPFVEISL